MLRPKLIGKKHHPQKGEMQLHALKLRQEPESFQWQTDRLQKKVASSLSAPGGQAGHPANTALIREGFTGMLA